MCTDTISRLRQRMIEDMNARKLCAATQTGHIRSIAGGMIQLGRVKWQSKSDGGLLAAFGRRFGNVNVG